MIFSVWSYQIISLWGFGCFVELVISKLKWRVDIFKIVCEIAPWDKCHMSSLVFSQHWLTLWLSNVRHQAITWANVDPDLCRHMASLSHNELIRNQIYRQIVRLLWYFFLILYTTHLLTNLTYKMHGKPSLTVNSWETQMCQKLYFSLTPLVICEEVDKLLHKYNATSHCLLVW